MSRSYKKNPWYKDYNRGSKKIANKTIRHGRHSKDIANGGVYKKYSCSWNICDFKIYSPYKNWYIQLESKWKAAINCRRNLARYLLTEQNWRKRYRMK